MRFLHGTDGEVDDDADNADDDELGIVSLNSRKERRKGKESCCLPACLPGAREEEEACLENGERKEKARREVKEKLEKGKEEGLRREGEGKVAGPGIGGIRFRASRCCC